MVDTLSVAGSQPSDKALIPSDIRTLGPWYLAEFIHSFAVTLYTTCAYFFAAEKLGAGPEARLWLSAGWGFTYVFFALLAGYWSEKWGPRRLIVRMGLGCVLTALTGLLTLHGASWGINTVFVFFLAMTSFNFTCNQLWPPLESAITRSPGKMRLSTRMAMYNVCWGGSSFIAFFGAPYVITWGWDLVFILPAVGCLVSSIIVIKWAIPEQLIGAEHVPDDEPSGGVEDANLVQRAKMLLYMAWIGNAMAYVAINVLIPLLPTVVKIAGAGRSGARVGGAVWLAAIVISGWPLLRTAGFLFTWRVTAWHYSVRWMIGSYVILLGSFVAMLAWPANLPLLLGAEVLFGLSTALLYSASLYYAMHVSSGAGGHAGIHEALIGMGIGIGPTAGALAGRLGFGGGTAGSDGIEPGVIWAVGGILGAGLIALGVLGVKAGKRATLPQAGNEDKATTEG